MTILSSLYKASGCKNLIELRIRTEKLNEEECVLDDGKYSDWVVNKLRGYDPELKVIKSGVTKEVVKSFSVRQFEFDLQRRRMLSSLKPEEIKEICMKLEMPGAIYQPKSYNPSGRLGDIDVYEPGMVMDKRFPRNSRGGLLGYLSQFQLRQL